MRKVASKTPFLILVMLALTVAWSASAVFADGGNSQARAVAARGVAGLVGTAVGAPPDKVDVIIGFNSAPGNAGDALIESHGGTINSRYSLIPARAASVPTTAIAGLLANPNVAYVEEDGFATFHTDSSVGELQWGTNRIDAEQVWNSYTGAGVKVAVLDSGIDADHPDLNANVLETWSVAGKPDASNPGTNADDKNGHGTATAGVIAAERDNSGTVGVAPDASLIAIQISKGPRLKTSDIIDGIELAVLRGAQVVSMSFGGGFSQAEADAITAASNLGLILVASAGNASGGAIGFPAALPEVIAVTSSTINDSLSGFSSVGSEAELIAPGSDIYTTSLNGGYTHTNGTSFSAPHVAGVAALLIEKGVADVRSRLSNTAEDIGLSHSQQGYGLVDAENAVLGTTTGDNLPGGPPPPPPPPGGSINAHVENTTLSYFDKGRPANRGPRIAITVEDEDGAPVAGATVDVALTMPDGSTLFADGTTDSSGEVTFRLTGSSLDGDYVNAVTSVSGPDISFVQCHDSDGTPDESTVTFTVSGTTATETGVVDECAP